MAGADTLSGGEGSDTFKWHISEVGQPLDTVSDFSTSEGDILDIGLPGYDEITDSISDFIIFTDNGSDSVMSVDIDGAGAGYSFVDVAIFTGDAGLLNADDLLASGNLIV